MTNTNQSPPGGDVEAREAAIAEIGDTINWDRDDHGRLYLGFSPEQFADLGSELIDAYLAKLTPTKAEPSRIEEIRGRHERDENGAGVPLSQFEANIHYDRGYLLSHITAIEAERDMAVAHVERVLDEKRELRSDRDQMRKALEPFARMATDIHPKAPDEGLCAVVAMGGGIMTNKEFGRVSDLRRARALLNPQEKNHE